MKTLAALVLVLSAFAPLVDAQTASSFTGKWEGTFVRVLPDGTEGNSNQVVFELSQKGPALTGAAGPPTQQWKIDKGAVKAGTASFQVQQPNGPLFKFTLKIVKGRLQGELIVERDGTEIGKAKVDAARAK